MVDAVELVRQRLLRAAAALRSRHVEYAVVGGNAVAAWVATIDESAVRNTQDVDIMIRRDDLPEARRALEAAGFVYRHAAGLDLFLDHVDAPPRSAVRIVFAGERVRPTEPAANPDVSESLDTGSFRLIDLAPLVRIKLTAFRDKDRTHLRDLIDVGLVDATWVPQLPGELATRLQQLLDTPEG